MVAVGRRHDVAIQHAGLDEVVVLRVQRVGVPYHLTRFHEPGWIAGVGIGFGSAVAVRCIHGQVVPVCVAHLAILVVAVDL